MPMAPASSASISPAAHPGWQRSCSRSWAAASRSAIRRARRCGSWTMARPATTDMLSLSTRTTSTGSAGRGRSACRCSSTRNNADYTNYLDGVGQKLGFAGRISINQDVLNDNKLLVQFTGDHSHRRPGPAHPADRQSRRPALCRRQGRQRLAGELPPRRHRRRHDLADAQLPGQCRGNRDRRRRVRRS